MQKLSMKYGIGILIFLSCVASTAQVKIFKCGNEYTNSISEAQARDCKQISGFAPDPNKKRPTPAPAKRSYRSGSSMTYEIEVAHNDELFIVNGEKFSSKTYCFNMEKGDQVKFVDGSPLGVCVSAVLLNLRTSDTCEVWCE